MIPVGRWQRGAATIAPRFAICAIALAGLADCSAATKSSSNAAGDRPAPAAPVVVLSSHVRDSMNAVFLRGNAHWNELAEVNTLTQMLGTGKPTQLEYLGCLRGTAKRDTVRITGWAPARKMKRFQFAVTGSCDSVPDAIGTWHTHPFRADSVGRPLKERTLSTQDLRTFAAGREIVTLAEWDVDSIDAAVRVLNGVSHPVRLAVD